MATIHLVVARVPLSVATGAVLPVSVRKRVWSLRDWKVVQLEVEVSSRYVPCVGTHASISNLRAALEPRSPAATSMTR